MKIKLIEENNKIVQKFLSPFVKGEVSAFADGGFKCTNKILHHCLPRRIAVVVVPPAVFAGQALLQGRRTPYTYSQTNYCDGSC